MLTKTNRISQMTRNQCCLNAGPSSSTLSQHWNARFTLMSNRGGGGGVAHEAVCPPGVGSQIVANRLAGLECSGNTEVSSSGDQYIGLFINSS